MNSGNARPRVVIASSRHVRHATAISRAIRREVARGTLGMALRSPALLRGMMRSGKAVIALDGDSWVGFCYISPWQGGAFVSTSALIVKARYRGRGLARSLKEVALGLCRKLHPRAVPFGLSTSPAVARINQDLGFQEVAYREITRDPAFWKGCESCPFLSVLRSHRGARCRCTAMAMVPRGTGTC